MLSEEHRDTVIARMEELQKHLDKVTWKTGFFAEKLEEYEKNGNLSRLNAHSGYIGFTDGGHFE